jgi:Phosphotransferase enzyme family
VTGASAFDPVPMTVEAVLDPAWLADALEDRADDERVISVDRTGHQKTIAEKVRFAVTFERPDGSTRVGQYCVKSFFGDDQAAMPEALIYRDVLPHLGLRIPGTHYVGHKPDTGRAIMIMDDIIGLGGHIMSPQEVYSLETARSTLGQLAKLHAQTWGDEALAAAWPTSTGQILDRFPEAVLGDMLTDGRGPHVAPYLRDAATVKSAMYAHIARPATNLVHGDTHSANAYIDSEGRGCWFDWQLLQWGHWSTDIAYHIGSIFDVETRRANEAELLRHYLRQLEAHGVTLSWDEAWEDYTLGFTWGFFLWAITSIASRSMVLIHFPRLATALDDHDTFRRLGII